MTDKIVPINVGKPKADPKHDVNQEVIDALEMTLSEAKKGNVHSVAIAGLRYDGTTIMAGRLSPVANAFEMIGAIEMMKIDMATAVLEQI